MPMSSEEYEDADGNSVVMAGDTIIISNQCLIVDIDIDGEDTVECSHFEPIEQKEDNDFSLSKYLK